VSAKDTRGIGISRRVAVSDLRPVRPRPNGRTERRDRCPSDDHVRTTGQV